MSDNSLHSLAEQYKRQWPKFWKITADHNRIERYKKPADLFADECVCMVNGIESLIEQQRSKLHETA